VPGKFFQQFRSGCGISRDFIYQVLNLGMFPLDEAQEADVLLFVQ
jgi:hypothetical protein